jgi:hypothetical protein
MSQERLQKALQNGPKTMTNQLKSAKSLPGATLALEAPERLPTFSRPVAQNKMWELPGGLFGPPRGGERKFGGALGDPKIDKNRLKITRVPELAPKAAPRDPGGSPRLPKGGQKVPKKEPRGGPKGAP